MFKTRKMISLVLAFVILLETSTIYYASASFINTSGYNNVIIDCPQYISGIKNINVYSNVTYKKYQLLLNGSLLNSISTPVKYVKGNWKSSYFTLVYGTGEVGTKYAFDFNDANTYFLNSQAVTGRRRARFEVYFSPYSLPVDYSTVNFTRIAYSITIAANNPPIIAPSGIEVYNYSSGAWISVTALINGVNTGNVTFNSARCFNTRTYTLDMRILIEDNNGHQFTVTTSYFYIYFGSSTPAITVDNYKLIDTYALNSSAHVDGIYNLTAKVTGVNNVNYTDQKYIIIDNTKPVINNLAISPLVLNNTIPINVSTMISDAYLNDTYGQFFNGFNTVQVPNGNNQLFSFMNYYSNGSYNFYVYAKDQAGNINFKNKSFVVAYASNVQYINNPIIDVSHLSKEYVNNTAWINISCRYVSTMKLYINNSLTATYTSPTIVKYGLNSTTIKTFNVVLQFYYSNATFFKNITFSTKFYLPIINTVYIYNPDVIVSYQSQQYVNKTSWINITTSRVSKVKIYINGTLNSTFNNPVSVNFSLTSSNPKTFSIVLEFFYSNNSFYNNHSLSVKFVNPSIVYVYNPQITIAYQSQQYFNKIAWINITALYISKIKMYINGTLNNTYNYPTSINFSVNSSTLQIFEVVIETFYSNVSFFKNFTVLVKYMNVTSIITYINNPIINLVYQGQQYIDKVLWVNMTCSYLSKINLYINGTLNSTYNNPISINFSINSSSIQSFTIVVETFYLNTTFFKNFTVFVKFINVTSITTYINNPGITISYSPKQYINNNSWINITSIYTSKFNLYANGTLNNTYTNPTSVNHSIVSSSIIKYNIVLQFFYANNSFYKNYSLLVEFVNVSVITQIIFIDYTRPSFSISYPSFVLQTNHSVISISTLNSQGFGFNITRNNVFINYTFYIGNTTHYFTVPSDTLGNVNYTVKIYYPNATLYKKISFIVQITLPVVVYETISISYEPFVYKDSTVHINGNMTFIANVTIIVEEYSQTTNYANVNNFTFGFYVPTYASVDYITFNVTIVRNNTKIYQRDFSINILPEPSNGDGNGGNGGNGGDEGFNWALYLVSPGFWLLILGGGMIGFLLIAIFVSRRREPQKPTNGIGKKRKKKRSGAKTSYSSSGYVKETRKNYSGARTRL